MDISKITKQEFDLAYNKFQPNLWTKLSFRYFSTNTEKSDMKVRKSLQWVMIALFLVGFVSTVIGLPRPIIAFATITYSLVLLALGIFMGMGALMNNMRIKKISKVLGVTKWEYQALVDLFYPAAESLPTMILK